MKTCPRCYSKVEDDVYTCPTCKFQLARIAPSENTAPRQPRDRQPPPPPVTKQRRLKKGEIVIMVSIIAVFVLLLVIFNAPAPSRRSSSSASRTSSSSSVSSSSSGGGSSGSSFGTGGSGSGSAKSEKEDTTITYVVGEERSLTAEGPIYFAPRQADMNDFVAGTDADGLMEAGKLLVLEDGTNVALVKVLQNMAFVDILDGEQAGSRGYVEISVIR